MPESSERSGSKHRKMLLLVSSLLLLLAAVTVLEFFVFRSRSFALLAAINFNIALFLLLLVLIFRNIIKLYVERRRRAGSKLRTRLLLTFISLAVLPSVALFLSASKLITSSLVGWFDPGLERMTDGVASIVSTANAAQLQYALNAARIGRDRLAAEGRATPLANARSEDVLGQIRLELDISSAQLFDQEGTLLAAAPPAAGGPAPGAGVPRMVRAVLETGVERAELDLSGTPPAFAAAVPAVLNPSSTGCLLVRKTVTGQFDRDIRAITAALAALDDRQHTVSDARTWYVTILLLITLTIIFSATWLGMYLAREITGPIDRLVEATRTVASGQYDIQLSALGYDEISELIISFNNMTRDLLRNRDNLELTHSALRAKNLELEQRTAELETVLGNIATGVIALSPEGIVQAINDSACRLLHVPSAAAVGFSIRDIVRTPDLSPLHDLVSGSPQSLTFDSAHTIDLFRESGAMHLSVRITRMPGSGAGAGTGALVILEDLTHLMRSQRIAAWQEVARRIAHEIKNPLTPIQLNAERLIRKLQELAVPPETKDALARLARTIVDSVDSMKGLVNEFSQFARMPEVALRPANLGLVLEQAIDVYSGMAEEVAINSAVDPALPLLNLDPDQLKRAVINLLDNAIQAMRGRGRIRISSELCPELGTVRLHFDDDGPGVPLRERHRIFLPYFSTKPGGSGLGLAIVQRVVADHGGYVRVNNRPEGGARFTIELPLPVRTTGGEPG